MPTAQASTPTLRATVWSDQFESSDWLNRWRVRRGGSWGLDNTEVMADPSGRFEKILRVRYPAGSASPTVARQTGAPVGGAQFFGGLGLAPSNRLRLQYYVKFSKDFDFVKGGKLPGLFGGTVNDGRRIPDGTNGFSTRYMWRRNGAGEVYAYLPTSSENGTSLGRGNWRFKPGVWQRLEQEVTLNTPGKSDGRIQVWVDGNLVLSANNLTFRTTENLRIEGILFSTFFGGGDPSWATPEDVYVDFADFAVN
ncbi:polysaccharide lyase [Leptolyngbya sp. FACHB-261]|uniref:polysaccharide lyase n=1 Tax=Leptolyngbya sp. FACHB-261 TaxID=2692806 RepID=UPI0016824305|nr:hypothetical protein [Leptolyngbya sp. FACHB-261]